MTAGKPKPPEPAAHTNIETHYETKNNTQSTLKHPAQDNSRI